MSPVTWHELDASAREEDIMLLLGKNIVLKLVEDRKANELVQKQVVTRILGIKDLCHKDARDSIDSIIRLFHKRQEIALELLPPVGYLRRRQRRAAKKVSLVDGNGRPSSARRRGEREDLEIPPFLVRYAKRFRASVIEDDKKMVEQELALQKVNPGIHVLYPSVVLFCSACGFPLMEKGKQEPIAYTGPHGEQLRVAREVGTVLWGDIKGETECLVCGSAVTRNGASRVLIHNVDQDLLHLWEQNLWFEEYFAGILRSLDWKTWTHVHVLGTSGILHEVDVLAIKKSYIICVECKTGKVSREDVFNFSIKLADVKAHVGCMALLKQLPESETREFIAKSPALVVIEEMDTKKETAILAELKSSVVSRI